MLSVDEKTQIQALDRTHPMLPLRPGTYTVTFTLPGFNTFVRDGIELVSDFTANVDGQMTVGSIEETVTVSGASPVIDVQNVVSQENLSREELDTLPTSRTYFGLAALTPGMSQKIAGGGHDVGGGASKEFFLNQAAIEEMVISTSDMNAEFPYGGVATNAIPKEGANTFSYYVNVTGTNGDLQSANVDTALEARGASPLAKNRKVWDYGVGVGGPIVQDRVWFYTAHRWWGAQNFQPSGNFNIAPGYPNDPGNIGHGALYVADPDGAAWTDFYNRDNSIRFTIQASERHKFTLSQASWTFPASNRLLFEAGFSRLLNNSAPESNELVREDGDALVATGMTFEQFMAADPAFALQYVDVAHMSYAPLLNWRSHGIRTCAPCLLGTGHDFPTQVFRASMSYVSGSHNFKVGTDGRWAAEEHAEARLASNAWPIRLDFFTRDRVTGALGGGLSTGSTSYDECFRVDNPIRARDGFCNVSEPWSAGTQFKVHGAVPLPFDTQFSFVFQSLGGLPWQSYYQAGGAADAVMINGQPGVLPNRAETIVLTPSGQGVGAIIGSQPSSITRGSSAFFFTGSNLHEPRLNQLDVRFTKIIFAGGARIRGWVDLFNIFNANSTSGLSNSFVSSGYPRVSGVMGGRLLKFGAQFDF